MKQELQEKKYNTEVNTWDSVIQEDVNVPGHWADYPDHQLPVYFDDGDILIESNMHTDPMEGTQGSYTVIKTDMDCPNCPNGDIHQSVQTMVELHYSECKRCGWVEGL